MSDHVLSRRWLPPAALAATAVALLQCVVAGSNSTSWLGSASLTLTDLADYVSVTCLVLMIQSAYVVSTRRSRGADLLLTTFARSEWEDRLLILSVGSGGAVGYVATSAVALWITHHRAESPSGIADLAPLVGGIAACVAAAGIGSVVGRWIPWPPLSVLLAPAAWAVLALLVRGSSTQNLLLNRSVGDPAVRVSPTFYLLLAAMYFAATGALRAAVARPDRRLGAAIALVALAGAAAGVLMAGGAGWNSIDGQRADIRCTDGTGYTLCLTVAEEPARPSLDPIASEAVRSTQVVDPDHVTFVSSYLDPADVGPSADASRLVPIGARDGFRSALTADRNSTLLDLLPALINPGNCPIVTERSDRELHLTTMGEVVFWQFDQLRVVPGTSGMTDAGTVSSPTDLRYRLAAMSTRQQRDYFASHHSRLVACQPI